MRKISETFLAFVAPILATIADEAGEAAIESTLKIGFTVWNSMVYDEVNGNNAYVDRLRELMAGDPASKMLIGLLIHRKQELFADDLRLIGQYKVTHKHGQLNLWAEARDPHSHSSKQEARQPGCPD